MMSHHQKFKIQRKFTPLDEKYFLNNHSINSSRHPQFFHPSPHERVEVEYQEQRELMLVFYKIINDTFIYQYHLPYSHFHFIVPEKGSTENQFALATIKHLDYRGYQINIELWERKKTSERFTFSFKINILKLNQYKPAEYFKMVFLPKHLLFIQGDDRRNVLIQKYDLSSKRVLSELEYKPDTQTDYIGFRGDYIDFRGPETIVLLPDKASVAICMTSNDHSYSWSHDSVAVLDVTTMALFYFNIRQYGSFFWKLSCNF